MKRFGFFAVLLSLVLSGAGSAGAQVATADRIVSIEVQGSQRVEPATVKSYMTVHEGDAFNPTEVDNSLKSLFATGPCLPTSPSVGAARP